MADISGGRNAELDSELRDRIRQSIAALPKGTVASLVANLIGTSAADTNQIISRARIVEDFGNNFVDNSGCATVYAYVDDSSVEFSTVEERHASDTLSAAIVNPAPSLPLVSVTGFPQATISNSEFVIIDPVGVAPFVTEYQSISSTTLTNLNPAAPSFPINTVVSMCEAISTNTEENRKYYRTSKYPLGDDGITLFLGATGAGGAVTRLVQLLPGNVKTFTITGALVEDFIVNESTGQIEFFAEKIPILGSGIYNTRLVYRQQSNKRQHCKFFGTASHYFLCK